MMEQGFAHSSPKVTDYSRVSKRCPTHTSPKLTLSGNFTRTFKDFDVKLPERRVSMRRDILDTVMKRTEEVMEKDENPLYEDPRDVIGDKPVKPPRKRNTRQTPVKEDKSSIKRKLTKKYEGLITTLMDRCEENVILISEKDSQLTKLKDKLKTVLDYNKLFAEENDQLKSQHTTLIKYIEECKAALKDERIKNEDLEEKRRDLEERVKKFEVPDREQPTAISLVEVCMSCSSRQIVLRQAREHSARLQRDMLALKDVLYRLNVQLSRYQEKLRADAGSALGAPRPDSALDSLIATSLNRAQDTPTTEDKVTAEQNYEAKVVDMSGLLSAQALAPLFDAYQENIQEKDILIQDYEKQFENINKKSKQIVIENKSLSERVSVLEQELGQARQVFKKLVVEKETGDIERATLLERADRAETKLKEVYEMYEDKMSAMMRDYETVHREYYAVRAALDAGAGAAAAHTRTVPADVHERRLDQCQRLLEELKHQYSMETERKTDLVKKLEEQLREVEEKYIKICKEHEVVKEELKVALKNARLYRKAAVIFRQRVKSATARASKLRRSRRRGVISQDGPLREALGTLERIKGEIKQVKTRAQASLAQLERRLVEQERRAVHAAASHRRALQRAAAALDHKEDIIRRLIDKVADVEEVRLSQVNIHRLQGIRSDSDRSPSAEAFKEQKHPKLVPSHGGFYKESESKRKMTS